MFSSIKEVIKPLFLKTYTFKNNAFVKKMLSNNNAEIQKRNEMVTHLKGERVLILAPHVDDDVIGCGGAILQYLKKGKEVHIAYLTTGQKNGTHGLLEKEIIEERKKEAVLVANELGLSEQNLHFLNSRDSELLTTDISEELGNLMKTYKPDTVFFPSIIDTHVDHYATSKKICDLYNKDKELFNNTTLMMYEVQSPISPVFSNIILDITNEFEEKRKLLTFYKSQRTKFYFLPIMDKLNGLLLGKEHKAELYIKSDIKTYSDFVNRHFEDNATYFALKEKLIAHRDHRNTIDTYNSTLDIKKSYLEL